MKTYDDLATIIASYNYRQLQLSPAKKNISSPDGDKVKKIR